MLEGLGFSMSPEAAMKRPLEHTSRDERVPEPKRVKTETAHESEEGSVEDGLALLIQNTLANINDLVGNASGGPDDPTAPRDPIDVDSLPAPEATPAPPAPVTFTSDPEKYIQHTNIYALGNLVCHHTFLPMTRYLSAITRQYLSSSLYPSARSTRQSSGWARPIQTMRSHCAG